jgi:amino acid permease
MTLVALMNAMIGGTILVLPLLYLKAGWLPALVVTTITGIINYFSCKICFDHLLGDSDMPEAIYRHTKSRVYPKVYDVAVFLSVQLVLLLYFDLIVKQWDSILMVRSIVTAVVNAVVLFALVGMIKRFNLGVNVMGYGIASILGYLLFLIWLLASRPKGD